MCTRRNGACDIFCVGCEGGETLAGSYAILFCETAQAPLAIDDPTSRWRKAALAIARVDAEDELHTLALYDAPNLSIDVVEHRFVVVYLQMRLNAAHPYPMSTCNYGWCKPCCSTPNLTTLWGTGDLALSTCGPS